MRGKNPHAKTAAYYCDFGAEIITFDIMSDDDLFRYMGIAIDRLPDVNSFSDDKVIIIPVIKDLPSKPNYHLIESPIIEFWFDIIIEDGIKKFRVVRY